MIIFVATYRDMNGNHGEAHFIEEHLAKKFIQLAPYNDIDPTYEVLEIWVQEAD